MRKIKVTFTVVAYINQHGLSSDSAELERAVDMVMDDPVAYYDSETASCEAEFVDVEDEPRP